MGFWADGFFAPGFWVNGFWYKLASVEQSLNVYVPGIIRKRRRLPDRPTDEQVKAERIRLGIIEARQERKRVIAKVKQAKNSTEQAQELNLYAYLLQEEISRLEAEYNNLKASLEAQGEMVRAAAITRAAMAWIEEEIRHAKQEEDDISFLLTMLAEL